MRQELCGTALDNVSPFFELFPENLVVCTSGQMIFINSSRHLFRSVVFLVSFPITFVACRRTPLVSRPQQACHRMNGGTGRRCDRGLLLSMPIAWRSTWSKPPFAHRYGARDGGVCRARSPSSFSSSAAPSSSSMSSAPLLITRRRFVPARREERLLSCQPAAASLLSSSVTPFKTLLPRSSSFLRPSAPRP